ncbi:MAG TPA: SagB family peptide dehydrogenase [Candidatus Dormibacteraeota bacterium]
MEVLARLEEWRSFDDLVASGVDVTRDALERLVAVRLLEGMAFTDTPRERDGCDPRVVWNAYELAVQRNSNRGGLRASPLDCEMPPLRRAQGAQRVPLPPPAAVLADSLSDVLGRRRSLRRYASRRLTIDELSTLLHHAARVVSARPTDEAPTEALRPYAAAGARSELEIYVVAENVGSVFSAVYRYDAFVHQLEQVRARDADQERFLRDVSGAAGGLRRIPPVALLITAVFGRIMHRYEGIGLTLIYEDCGCLIQTLYLVATAMGLAPCAIGTPAELQNSRWLGLDPMIEAPVGCVLIGPRAGSS